ncbi:uncharacterized protein LOC114789149 [Denticeps clupeoides]|uniref:uncharacterized protein LOC114789149 n=1 Tax=Denticeps clupeoides TaxID=299321 RepID=UPI0010A47FF8|nr:uncharacterized protein LOC114789149 [Denticeps clupeoides]
MKTMSVVDHWLLFLPLLCAPEMVISQGKCSAPSVLCCVGQNNFCYRGCYCDQFCIENKDCCSDYIPTCQPTTAEADSTALPAPQTTADAAVTTGTTLAGPATPSQTPAPPPKSSTYRAEAFSSGGTAESTLSSTTSTGPKESPPAGPEQVPIRVYIQAKVAQMPEHAALNTLQNFVRHVESNLQRNVCSDCTVTILRIEKL